MKIIPAGARPSREAPATWFTGSVWMDPVIEAPARVVAIRVSFAPGARTAWHTHPLGQTLLVLSGVGRVALRGAPPREIRPGDTVWIPAGAEHWHGAAPETGMVHLAMQEALDEVSVEWREHVSDADYLRDPAG
ncbi:cupin domain-containing protein [Pikeienuella sp. HZG-20]|uniref:(R)-mandelonitrile lyase n=1 Tax=Paludibacillus litoralis TaxID=3133267 RepID=UPI0030EC6CD9